MSLAVAIAGPNGRMGQALIASAKADGRFLIAGAAVRPGSAPPLDDFGGAAISDDPAAAAATAQAWLDFTTPQASARSVQELVDTPVHAVVIGTTNLDADQEAAIAATASRFAIVRSGNFSLGVNLLAALVERAAVTLGQDWDIELREAHHRGKRDAPSGTALLLGEAAARGRKVNSAETFVTARAAGPRREGSIGISVLRGGGIAGDHDVVFAANHEVLTLSHRALDRAVFAEGALAAALWAASRPPGLYSMRDVLGL